MSIRAGMSSTLAFWIAGREWDDTNATEPGTLLFRRYRGVVAAGEPLDDAVKTFGGGSRGMLAKLFSYTLIGIDAAPVEVEVDVSATSMPKTVLVGLRRSRRQGKHAPR